jgi:hypothetical protein
MLKGKCKKPDITDNLPLKDKNKYRAKGGYYS